MAIIPLADTFATHIFSTAKQNPPFGGFRFDVGERVRRYEQVASV